MNVELEKYANRKICVAVSGGKDSMALLHYLLSHGAEYGISVCALNCDHGIRGEASERDSAFVKAYCGGNGIYLYCFSAKKGDLKDENGARKWRLECYKKVIKGGNADCIATAHHMNDNAETVLFNLARGASVSGVCGIGDEPALGIIRPLIRCTREEIDGYVEANGIEYVTDESNLTDDYTRNKIRRRVLPELEGAVHGAVGAIYRFSRLAREDEEYFSRQVQAIIVRRGEGNYLIKPCREKVIFKRAAGKIVAEYFGKCDYTAEHLENAFNLQSLDNGKKFEFLGLIAIKEEDGVAVTEDQATGNNEIAFADLLSGKSVCEFGGGDVRVLTDTGGVFGEDGVKKTLSFDLDKIPSDAVVRRRRVGDKFTKFGGGTLSLSDYLTDKKVPQSLRGTLPLVCSDSEVLLVGGVEISDKIKITSQTENKGIFICNNPLKLS